MNSYNFSDLISQSDRLILTLRKRHGALKGAALKIISVEDFRRLLSEKTDSRHLYFTNEELDYCKNRIASLAGRYAAKLAIREALHKQIPWKDISILSSQSGEPILSFSNSFNNKSKTSISISHEGDLVSAFAVVTDDSTVAIGVDATSFSRISELAAQTKVLQKILTKQELAEIKDLPTDVARRWAGKEAVSKAIGIGIWHGSSLRDIEILNNENKSLVRLKGKVLTQAEEKKLFSWDLDYIKDEKFILACLIAED